MDIISELKTIQKTCWGLIIEYRLKTSNAASKSGNNVYIRIRLLKSYHVWWDLGSLTMVSFAYVPQMRTNLWTDMIQMTCWARSKWGNCLCLNVVVSKSVNLNVCVKKREAQGVVLWLKCVFLSAWVDMQQQQNLKSVRVCMLYGLSNFLFGVWKMAVVLFILALFYQSKWLIDFVLKAVSLFLFLVYSFFLRCCVRCSLFAAQPSPWLELMVVRFALFQINSKLTSLQFFNVFWIYLNTQLTCDPIHTTHTQLLTHFHKNIFIFFLRPDYFSYKTIFKFRKNQMCKWFNMNTYVISNSSKHSSLYVEKNNNKFVFGVS